MRALKNIKVSDILFLDIETVAGAPELTEDHPLWQAWLYKNRNSKEFDRKDFAEELPKSFEEKGALYAEFGQIVCITIGHVKEEEGLINVTSFYGEDEADILVRFFRALDKFKSSRSNARLCGHAIKVFDIPYIFKRAVICGVPLHDMVDTSDLKPWELNWITDTMDLFKSTSFAPTSLIALAAAFGLPNPKQDISGEETTATFYNGEVERVAQYCERDVVTTANVYMRLAYKPTVEKAQNGLDFKSIPILERVAKLGKYTKEEATTILEAYEKLKKVEEKEMAATIIKVSFTKSVEELYAEFA